MTKRQTEFIRMAATVEAGDEGTAWRDRLDEWLVLKDREACNFTNIYRPWAWLVDFTSETL